MPPPVQKPHPPMYIAATRTRETQDFAAASGHSGIIGVVLDTTDGLDLCYQLVDGAREAGKPMDIGGIPFFRYFYVAETEEQARRDSEAALNWTHGRQPVAAHLPARQRGLRQPGRLPPNPHRICRRPSSTCSSTALSSATLTR